MVPVLLGALPLQPALLVGGQRPLSANGEGGEVAPAATWRLLAVEDTPPAEYEAAFYAVAGNDQTEVGIPTLEPL